MDDNFWRTSFIIILLVLIVLSVINIKLNGLPEFGVTKNVKQIASNENICKAKCFLKGEKYSNHFVGQTEGLKCFCIEK